ncbi:hypothetical protein [Pantoea vagans]|uniref:hypothetical protein n=1 Tax=Pantoea vagans TaxID=470934 RepID=UPI0023B1D011|nr:hypothetical protein [Pantoea vagans]MDE8555115.1 hypothetical protein [Pantoea vagans]MDE8575166.1 hypothetical protein [Pantoea vagans]
MTERELAWMLFHYGIGPFYKGAFLLLLHCITRVFFTSRIACPSGPHIALLSAGFAVYFTLNCD